jgi:hypothetical protein
MEYVPGETLSDRLTREGALSVDESLGICLEVARALEAAHRRGIVHRDLKPANIKLVEGQVKVLDFGIAQIEGDVGLTLGSGFLGTPAYSAPERADGRGDIRADIYSLGVILYELLAGERPFAASSPLAVMRAHETAPVPALPPAVPATADAVVRRSLAKHPEDRYQTPFELIAALVGACEAGGFGAVRDRREPGPRRQPSAGDSSADDRTITVSAPAGTGDLDGVGSLSGRLTYPQRRAPRTDSNPPHQSRPYGNADGQDGAGRPRWLAWLGMAGVLSLTILMGVSGSAVFWMRDGADTVSDRAAVAAATPTTHVSPEIAPGEGAARATISSPPTPGILPGATVSLVGQTTTDCEDGVKFGVRVSEVDWRSTLGSAKRADAGHIWLVAVVEVTNVDSKPGSYFSAGLIQDETGAKFKRVFLQGDIAELAHPYRVDDFVALSPGEAMRWFVVFHVPSTVRSLMLVPDTTSVQCT